MVLGNNYEDNLVSIIMPAYNAEKHINEAINSVINQTYPNWELLIIDDHSIDNTVEFVKQTYKNESRIKLYKLEKNLGVANARNHGLINSKGRYIAFLDTDDLWMPNKIEYQLKFMKLNKLYFVTSGYLFMDEKSNIKDKKYIPPELITFEKQLKGNRIGCLTVIIDREITGDFMMPDLGHEDYATWITLIKKFGPINSIREPLAVYRDGNNSISSNKLKAAKWQWQIYRKYLNLSFIKSINYFINYMVRGVIKKI